ncbi:MAG: tRNA methyl transferase PRC-barrel domain-containing protein, partial [Wenzhouxiangellaceae bacterium]
TTTGQPIGQHRGLIHYTLGQRRGLNIGGVRGCSEAPWYVVYKNLRRNRLYVTQDAFDPHLLSTELTAHRLTWVSGVPPDGNRPLSAKIRYRQADQPV